MAYISKENFIAFIDKKIDKNGLGYVIGNQLKDYINKQPTADVAEVVRCGKCRKRNTKECWCSHWKMITKQALMKMDFAVAEKGGVE